VVKRHFTARDGRRITIRHAVPQDAGEIIKIIDAIAREGIYFLRSRFRVSEERERAFISSTLQRGDAFLVAEHDGRLVGWLTLARGRTEYTRHTAEIGLGVILGYRDVGIGRTLLMCALEWATEKGLEKITLGVRASNQRAIHLYEALGFVREGRRVRQIKDNHGRYDDDILMAKFL